MMVAMANSPARTPPMIAPVSELDFDDPPEAESEPEVALASWDEVAEADAVAEGITESDVGESAFRHVLSSVAPTTFTSELPPLRPWESLMIHMTETPSAKFAIHSYVVGPAGGLRTNVSPPGMTPVMVTGCTAPV